MKFSCASLAFAALGLLATSAQAGGVEGDWMTPKDSAKVHIAPCGPKLCGTIVWLKHPLDKVTGEPQKDAKNPDAGLRGRGVVGLQVIRDFKPAAPGRWSGGSIYDPAGGKTYDSEMSLNPDGTLKVEGCVAVFCVAQTWTRAR